MSSQAPEQDLNHIDSYRTPGGQVRWRVRLRLGNSRRLSRSFPELVDAQNWRDQQLISQRHLRRAQTPVLPDVLGGLSPSASDGNGGGTSGALAAMPVAAFIKQHYWPSRAQK